MVKGKDLSGRLEWRVNIPDGTSEIVETESGLVHGVWPGLKRLVLGFMLKIWKFLEKAWELAVSEPKKVIHCVKVGVALSLVSLLYYVRPLYDGFGGNAMWAVMTVVVVFEQNVGATLSKCINRTVGTFLAGSLGVGVHWVADKSGETFEPIILGVSVFIFATAATFSRFIPSVKARFDYGAIIFILTFSLVSVSGYRIEKLLDLAHQRLSTIAIGTSLCIIISMFCCPIWAGDELHRLIHCNLDKLAHSFDGCVAEYFKDNTMVTVDEEDSSKKIQGHRCVLNSKAAEESLANFARWEPAHGRFNFRHPWKQYLKIGATMRSCARCIETLNSCISSDTQAPEYVKKYISKVSTGLSSSSSNILKELAITMRTMKRSSKIDSLVNEMNVAVQDLQNALQSLPNQLMAPSLPTAIDGSSDAKGEPETQTTTTPFAEVLPLATFASLLIEIASRIERIIDEVGELASSARFKPATDKSLRQNQPTNSPTQDI
ncbi:aluminum-activated malate transporter 10 [Malania oleifera]|uniref:aluminum-activated malate transporter 10 n=1 Tax=Malania oleifera TaxID=397392 RepID=UPI0025ADB7B3|nr:aluminum-activated malate transporter 10 [Malania oleifera]